MTEGKTALCSMVWRNTEREKEARQRERLCFKDGNTILNIRCLMKHLFSLFPALGGKILISCRKDRIDLEEVYFRTM